MLTDEHIKEGLSRAYVQAVSAKAGVILSLKDRGHDYGIDGSFHEVSDFQGRKIENGNVLDFQLKATTRIDVQEDFISFQLEAKTINLLASRVGRSGGTRAILIILSLPPQSEEWVQLNENELILKNCCYWSSISSLTPNIYNAKHRIPRGQLFTPGVLSDMLRRVSSGVPI